jgi:hypothetical protein
MKNNNIDRVQVVKEKINNTNALKDLGLRVMHFNPAEYGNHDDHPVTVGYRLKNRHTIEITTSICHSQDTFTKKVGTKNVIDNFYKGKTCLVPLIKSSGVQNTISMMFNI